MENAGTSGGWLVASLLAFAAPVLAQDFSPALLRAMPIYQQCVRGEAAASLKDRKLRPNEILERAFVACKTEEEMVQKPIRGTARSQSHARRMGALQTGAKGPHHRRN
jgi:hypothetical protein